jgi:hypothetical protein
LPIFYGKPTNKSKFLQYYKCGIAHKIKNNGKTTKIKKVTKKGTQIAFLGGIFLVVAFCAVFCQVPAEDPYF